MCRLLLPESFVHDPDRVPRFRREAQVLASLNHPHIAASYGLEEANGSQFLVLELVEGGTLADRLKAGSLPLDEALAIRYAAGRDMARVRRRAEGRKRAA